MLEEMFFAQRATVLQKEPARLTKMSGWEGKKTGLLKVELAGGARLWKLGADFSFLRCRRSNEEFRLRAWLCTKVILFRQIGRAHV